MKTCPECMNQVVDVAIKCKYCGYDFAPPPPVARPITKPLPDAQENTASNKNIWISLLVIAAIIGLFLLWRNTNLFHARVDPRRFGTPTALHQTYEAKVKTQTAGPTATFIPTRKPTTPTPDRRTSYEKCDQASDFPVHYTLTGSAKLASVTWENNTNGTEQGDRTIPFCVAYKGMESGEFLYISAQIISDYGDIECRITYKGQVIARAHASGFPNIATCSSSVP